VLMSNIHLTSQREQKRRREKEGDGEDTEDQPEG
jgi:hypothetical protein